MRVSRLFVLLAVVGWVLAIMMPTPRAQATPTGSSGRAQTTFGSTPPAHAGISFATSDNCVACHNGLTAPTGEDVSIGIAWRASMMANSSRDPYWQASVRREILDHPGAQAAIEDECSICHMPMARATAAAAGQPGRIFTWLPVATNASGDHRLAADGVSCALCHQIGPDRLGTPESFVGNFVLATGASRMLGPYEIDRGRTTIMRSVTGSVPAEGPHLRQSEVCATCHTLITPARLGRTVRMSGRCRSRCRTSSGAIAPSRRSAAASRATCRLRRTHPSHRFWASPGSRWRGTPSWVEISSCCECSTASAPTWGSKRKRKSSTPRRTRPSVSSSATPPAWTSRGLTGLHGRSKSISPCAIVTGHKFPTGYPSRRAWLHLTVRDANGSVVFESGAVNEKGMIGGNDNDTDPLTFEPHYEEIRRPDEVQVYESMMADPVGRLTTGLLQAVTFVKDNRLLPRGFDKRTAAPEVAVRGSAVDDSDFTDAGDRVRYRIDVGAANGPFTVAVELRYQPISFRWADNLRRYDAPEPRRFVSSFDAMSADSSVEVAQSSFLVP